MDIVNPFAEVSERDATDEFEDDLSDGEDVSREIASSSNIGQSRNIRTIGIDRLPEEL